MTDLITIDLDKEWARVEQLRLAWKVTHKKKLAAIADSNATKTTPPANYWQEERKAWREYGVAYEFLIALQEAAKR